MLTDQGLSPARASEALDVQGKVGRTNLVNKLEAAMGSGYGGVWFEPASALLHIGVTSHQSALAAEGAAANASLTANVTTTQVRSTWAQLLATQKQWDHKVAHLFAHAQVETGLQPSRNAVIVTISSSVPAPERAALEHSASTANVNVFVNVVPGAQIGGSQEANLTECNEWASSKAYCNPSITSGVTITEAAKSLCTAGPLAIPKANKKERVLVTAGHCIEKAGQKWEAFNKAGAGKVIGGAIEFSNGAPVGTEAEGLKATECFGKCDGGDYGDITIEPAWQTEKANDPVFAVTAEWKPEGPGGATSYPVKGERAPVQGNTSCHEGQTSGQSCGTIEKVNQTVAFGQPRPACLEVAKEEEGRAFFTTKEKCQKQEGGGKGKWQLQLACVEVAKAEVGPEYFETKEQCRKNTAGIEKGKWKLLGFESGIVVIEGLTQVEGPKLLSLGGDSGGPFLFIEKATNEGLMEGTLTGGPSLCIKLAKEEKGPQFFKSEAECNNWEVAEGKEGAWERRFKCVEVAKAGEGKQFFETKEKCEKNEGSGKGKWERRQLRVSFFYPLGKTLEKLKLELLTTANEQLAPCG